MAKYLKVLIVEDSEDDTLFTVRELEQAGYIVTYEVVETEAGMRSALAKQSWDIVLSDFVLPGFSGLAALKLLNDLGLEIPCIIISGKITEETAVSAMKAGARDYIMKDNLKRLGPAIERELLETEIRREHNRTQKKLKESEDYFQAVIENAQDAIVVVNPDGALRYGNPALERLCGYRNEEIMGKKIFEFVHPDDVEGVLKIYNRGIKIPDFTVQLEIRMANKDGSWRSTEVVARNALQNPAVGGLILNIRDITERKRVLQEREFYIRRVVDAQEEERKRIARELHDDTAPSLAYLGLELDYIADKTQAKPAECLQRLKPLKEKLDLIQKDIRRFSHELHPAILENMGLEAALETLAAEMNALGQVEVQFKVDGPERRLPDEANLALYRITQEALNNVRKHSEARRAIVSLRYMPRKIKLSISDNGKGFNLQSQPVLSSRGGLGLIGMRERAQLVGAKLEINSLPGKGTKVLVEV